MSGINGFRTAIGGTIHDVSADTRHPALYHRIPQLLHSLKRERSRLKPMIQSWNATICPIREGF